jgi:hypothetical protein
MAWETVSEHSIKNGSYRVSSSLSGRTPVFTAWPPKPPYQKLNWRASVHQCIGCYPTVQQAKAACMAHAAVSGLCSFLCRQSGNRTEASA